MGLGIVSKILEEVGAGSGVGDFQPDNSSITTANSIYEAAENLKLFSSGLPWTFNGQDWYKTYPYSFVVTYKGETKFTYTLPIPPQNLLIKMIPASAVTATLGGVVEETSDNVFWVIQMSGTTGIAISRDGISDLNADRKDMANKFRKKLETTGLLSGVAAQLNTLLGKVGGTIEAIADAASAGSTGGVIGALNNTLLPQLPYNGSAVDGVTNGFTEIQEFHRFLYTFSHLKAMYPKDFALKFRSYKTGQEWRISMQDFTVQQSAQNPHLYRYNVQLKGWDVSGIDMTTAVAFDRFGPGGDLQAVNTVSVGNAYKGYKTISRNIALKPIR